MDKIEIPLSKKKIVLLLMAAVTFVVFGIIFSIQPETFVSPVFRSVEMVRFTGIAAIIFFGGLAVYGTGKLFDKSVGLTINDDGIFDNSNASSIGLIKWSDITEIRTEQVASTKFLLIYTSNPEEYLDKVKGVKKMLMKGNYKMYGTPLSITSNTLNYNFSDLENLLYDRFAASRENLSA